MQLVIVFFISFILALSVLFESGREHVEHATPEAFRPILLSLYGELTLLGFIGVLLFSIFQTKYVQELSMAYFGEPEAIEEIGERVHMFLFLVMMVFLLQAGALARFGLDLQRKWTSEEISRADFESVDFAHYLSVALGHVLGELVEIPPRIWVLAQLALLIEWVLGFPVWPLVAFPPALAVALHFCLKQHDEEFANKYVYLDAMRALCLATSVGLSTTSLASIPSAALVMYVMRRDVLENYTIKANVGKWTNQRFIQIVKTRQTTKSALEALFVVQALRSTTKEDKSRREDERRAAPKKDKKMEGHFRRIFSTFSGGESDVHSEEFANLLRKFCPEMKLERVYDIFESLDVDRNGSISFEEFYSFAADGSGDVDVFDLIDVDKDGSITVHEMHRVVNDYLSLDLSLDDVFAIVRDIDKDGDGQLDRDEFRLLLERLRVVV